MIKDRIREIRDFQGLSRRDLEKLTGIEEYKWKNVESGHQKVNEDHIEAIKKQWPQYTYWLITGETLPEAGQVSPKQEHEREQLAMVGGSPRG